MTEFASPVATIATEGLVTLWYQEDYRDDSVVICRVHHLGPDAGPGFG